MSSAVKSVYQFPLVQSMAQRAQWYELNCALSRDGIEKDALSRLLDLVRQAFQTNPENVDLQKLKNSLEGRVKPLASASGPTRVDNPTGSSSVDAVPTAPIAPRDEVADRVALSAFEAFGVKAMPQMVKSPTRTLATEDDEEIVCYLVFQGEWGAVNDMLGQFMLPEETMQLIRQVVSQSPSLNPALDALKRRLGL